MKMKNNPARAVEDTGASRCVESMGNRCEMIDLITV